MSRIALPFLALLFTFPHTASGQGETTSAILGQVADTAGAAIPGATVTITNRKAGMQRSLKSDQEGRFNLPQLKSGAYSVKVEAVGFNPQQNDNVFSGLRQKQTVNCTGRRIPTNVYNR